jgi:8-oxo-dGTP pyrophosphatase MutT (NUDIX family)
MSTPARPSASVVLVRSTPDGSGRWETYLVQRSTQSPLLADYWVFPGGTLRLDDYSRESQRLAATFPAQDAHTALGRAPGAPAETPEASLAYFIAAARELLEETGILLGRVDLPINPTSEPSVTAVSAAERLALERGQTFSEFAQQWGLELDLHALCYYGHWITPEVIPQRFDTRFFLAVLPPGQVPSPSPYEIAQGSWMAVPSALEQNRAGQLRLHFATLQHLRRLAPFRTLEDLLAFARTKPVVPVMPETREHDSRPLPYLPPDLEGAW